MPRRYLTHFSTIFIAHVVLLFGGLTFLDRDGNSQSLGQRILNLQFTQDKSAPAPEARRLPKRAQERFSQSPSAQSEEVKPGEMPQTTPALSGAAIADIKNLYKAQLRARIEENKFYPAAARRLGQAGTVIVAFTLLSDGTIINARIDRSSGSARLDSAGLEAVKKVKKFKAIPSELNANTLDLSVPIQFH